ncbi:MAG TPA: DUF4349 domain-containing protein [Methanosarcinaceae archaeon]|nr:DUF4349 domain-containing protein [Methanosarcinaceae archaeon]
MSFDQAMERVDMRRTYSVFVLIFLVFGILASGCLVGSDKSAQTKSVAYDTAIPERILYESESAYATEAGFSDNSYDELVEDSESVERKVISTADISIKVDDAAAAIDEIISITQEVGGFVSSSSVYNSYYEGDQKEGYATIRVPKDGFISVIGEIEMLGEVTSKSISGRDVTEEYIDLSARLENLERQEERLVEILNMTTTVEEVLDVEWELGRVRGEIESMTGRLKYLDDKVDFSTITVSVSEPRPITQSWGLRDALSDSVNGFISSVAGLIVFVGYTLPIVIFLTVIVGGILFIRAKIRG